MKLNHFFPLLTVDFETESELYIAMEYLAGGELFDYIADKQGLPESQARQIFSQIAAAVQHCHKVRKSLLRS